MIRVQANIVATTERRLLTWICGRLPRWVTPDGLTLLGFAGALLVFAGYALSRNASPWLWLAILGYVVHWFGDSLDGSLARHRLIERPLYGYFLDHNIDAIGNFIGMAGLGLTRFVRMDVALFALAGYLILSIHVFLRMRATGELQLSFLLGGPTELRLGLVALTLGMLWIGPLPIAGVSGYDLAIGGAGFLFVMLFIWNGVRTARRLRRAGA